MRYLRLILVVIVVSIILMVHELGHAIEMRNKGIPIESLGIGLDIWVLPSVEFPIGFFPDATFKISPLLLGAHVTPTEEGGQLMEQLPYSEFSSIVGMGVWVNLMVGLFFLSIVFLTSARRKENRSRIVLTLSLLVLLGIGRGIFVSYLIPVLGILMLVYVVINYKDLRGPLGAIRELLKVRITAVIAGISISLGLLNMVPLFPLDGGRIMGRILENYSQNLATGYELVSSTLLWLGIMVIVVADIRRR